MLFSEHCNKFKTIKMRPCTLPSIEFLRLSPVSFWSHFVGINYFVTHKIIS